MKLPDCQFYLFGMGQRRKFLHKHGMLLDALTGETIRKWNAASESIYPTEYSVELTMPDGKKAVIREDEKGVWVIENGDRACLTESRIKLSRFEGYPRAALLRVLHHEILINIVNGRPVPNFFVYSKPWYRDAAMMCMCLEETGNLHLVKEWILGLREPFDRNNAGNREPDNLGQALYMISLVSDVSHPLVETILQAIPQFKAGNHIVGITDGSEHPVYQTKWLKFGLRSLGLDDPYEIPAVFDSYSALFWMDYTQSHVNGPHFGDRGKELYPYLGWAEAHFRHTMPTVTFNEHQYPLTWEAYASEADYNGMELISQEYVEQKICAPHTWHAAEAFLYFTDNAL